MLLAAVVGLVFLALVFDFINGFHDAANSIATVVSTRVLTPFAAVAWAAFFNFIAAFGGELKVAKTMGKGIVEFDTLKAQGTNVVLLFVFAALMGAIIWWGLPSSSSHALAGGMIGAAVVALGWKGLIAAGILKIAGFIFISPLIGTVIGAGMMIGTHWLVHKKALAAFLGMVTLVLLGWGWQRLTHSGRMSVADLIFISPVVVLVFGAILYLTLWRAWEHTPARVDSWFRKLQLVSSAIFSFSHGTNDAQKVMGIIGVVLYGTIWSDREFHIPLWVVLACHGAIGLGTMFGGWKIVKTMGHSLTKLQPIGGFCAETGGGVTILGVAALGLPVSTTHTITGAIVGVGATKGARAVQWGVAGRIVWAWFFTIPAAALVAALFYAVGRLVVPN
jgi:PiT family inorganic phosphate transporter